MTWLCKRADFQQKSVGENQIAQSKAQERMAKIIQNILPFLASISYFILKVQKPTHFGLRITYDISHILNSLPIYRKSQANAKSLSFRFFVNVLSSFEAIPLFLYKVV